MDARVQSVNGVPIRLGPERWMHVVEHHDDLAGYLHAVLETIGTPDFVYEGDHGELLAVSTRSADRWLVVVYREVSAVDGFVITAFFTTRVERFERRRLLWRPEPS